MGVFSEGKKKTCVVTNTHTGLTSDQSLVLHWSRQGAIDYRSLVKAHVAVFTPLVLALMLAVFAGVHEQVQHVFAESVVVLLELSISQP